jgi:alpha-beta hydrolase superfamily lysophospholipase
MPLVAGRLPPGGMEELMRVQRTDFVNGLFYRSIRGAVQEMPGLVSEMAARYRFDTDKGIGLFGFSAGGSAVLLALMDSPLPISAAVVVNAPFSVEQNVKSWERALNQTFKWDAKSERAAKHFDVEGHAGRVASRTPPTAILVLQSTSDEHLDIGPAEHAFAMLKSAYRASAPETDIEFRTLKDAKHNFGAAETPIVSAAADWFRAHLAN